MHRTGAAGGVHSPPMIGRLVPAGFLVLAIAFAAVPVHAHGQESLRASEDVELIQLERDWDRAFLRGFVQPESTGLT